MSSRKTRQMESFRYRSMFLQTISPLVVLLICSNSTCPFFREKGLSVTVLIQSESQLSFLYGCEKATTIINNCDTIVFLGSMDLDTGRSISARANRPLEDILYMPIGSRNHLPAWHEADFTKRYNIFQNEMYKKITAAYEKYVEKELSQVTR